MFIGHFAVGLAGKRAAPRASLGVLVGAAILLDLLWPVFVLLGWERFAIIPSDSPFLGLRFDHYPWSHSLLAAFVWAFVAALLYFAWRRYATGAVTVWGLVVSHWVLDAVVHRPDMPLSPWAPVVVGLGVWSSPLATVAIELAMLTGGMALYLSTTRPRGRAGSIGLGVFLVLLLVTYAASATSPPDPSLSQRAVAVNIAGGLLMVALAWWFDRRRLLQTPGRR